MRNIRSPEPALLFTGALYSEAGIFESSKELLINNFGDVLFESLPLHWNYSHYYKDELGWPIFRKFVFFNGILDTGSIAEIKLKTNEIEDRFSLNGKRRINLDPGYLTLAKLVLVSTKNYSHRIYLQKGIYGEVTLIYDKDGTFRPHLFTYRDYQDKAYTDIFLHARELLKKELGA